MTRREDIEKASKGWVDSVLGAKPVSYYNIFRAGAEWADANPDCTDWMNLEDAGTYDPTAGSRPATVTIASDKLNALRAQLEVARGALEFYANKDNWERIEGHTKWASNFKLLDCALYNAGGGRARMAIAKIKEIEEGK